MDASCGPQNALSQLTKHTQRDTSLQHERQNYQGNAPQNAFRNGPGHDASLNSEFQRFSQGNGQEFQAQFSPHMDPQFVPQNQSLSAQNSSSKFNQQHNNDGRNHQWVQDFRGLSLNGENRGQGHQIQTQNQNQNQNQSQSQNRGVTSDWHLQFMQNMRQQNQNQGQYDSSMLQSNQFSAGQNMAYQPMMGHANQQGSWSQAQTAQHQMQSRDQLHSPQIDEQALQRQFDMVEKELGHVIEAQNPAESHEKEFIDDTEKEQFAQAAKKVQETMSNPAHSRSAETNQKFQQSSFLKLMTSIQSREVELSQDGEKLVKKSTGEDIRQYLSDPLKHERASESEPDYHVPQHGSGDVSGGVSHFNSETAPQRPESEAIRSHLPDPLAHIRDGALGGDLSALEAARVVSGGQVQENSWMEDEMWDSPSPNSGSRPSLLSAEEQEVYDDYRNDDY